VALVRTDISEEIIDSLIMVKRNGELQLLVSASVVSTSLILFTMMMEEMLSS
jgi:hypothetical protein